jgi:hypothetical protein
VNISVILERVENNGYRASALAPPLTAEAATRQEAIEKLREMIRRKLAGCEIIHLHVPDAGMADPWLQLPAPGKITLTSSASNAAFRNIGEKWTRILIDRN